MKKRALGAFAAALALAACAPPKYARYGSLLGDFTVSAPWGWSVMTDSEAPAFASVAFIGPFDPDFYLGAPSLTVRWYGNGRAHKLPDGRLELYANADDFVRQTLRDVYGTKAVLYGPGGEGGLALVDAPVDVPLKTSGLTGRFFVVLSPAPAAAGRQYGLEEESSTGRPVNMRKHGYVVVPMRGGFYVLCYPATRRGYAKYEDRFRALFGSFQPVTNGPGGAKLPIRAVPASS